MKQESLVFKPIFTAILLFAFVALLPLTSFCQPTGQNFGFLRLGYPSYSEWKGYAALNNSSYTTPSFSPCTDCGSSTLADPNNPSSPWRVNNDPGAIYNTGGSLHCFVLNSNTSDTDPIVGTNNGGLLKIPPGYTVSTTINAYNATNENSNKLSYDLLLNDTNCLVTFNYAMVLQSPGHTGYNNPFFQIEVFELSSSGVKGDRVVPCAFFEVIGQEPAPSGWYQIGTGYSAIVWQPWRQVSMNLEEFSGSQVRIEITLAGCSQSGHWAYGYFVGKVGAPRINVVACGDASNAAIAIAPSGFSNYQWYANPDNVGANELENIADTATPVFESTDSVFNITSSMLNQYGNDYFVKITSPAASTTIPGCVAFIKAHVESTRPIVSFTTSTTCQLSVNINNETIFPSEGILSDDGEDNPEHKFFVMDYGDGSSEMVVDTTAQINFRPNFSHTYAAPGNYTLKLKATYGNPNDYWDSCSSEFSRTINIPATPSFTLTDTTICKNTIANLTIKDEAMPSNIVAYWWFNPNEPDSTLANPYSATFTQSTQIIVKAMATSCNYTDTMMVYVQEFPDVVLEGDTLVCFGQTANITAVDNTGNTQQMQWTFIDPGDNPQFDPNLPITPNPVFQFSPTKDTIVYLIAKTDIGCMASKSIQLLITNPKISASREKVCPGDEVTLTGKDAVTYSWSATPMDPDIDTSLKTTTPLKVKPQQTTTYTMKGYGPSGCYTEKTITIIVIPYPEAKISYSPSYVDVDAPTISLKDDSKYGVRSQWSISDGTTSELRNFSHTFNDVSVSSVNVFLKTFNEVDCPDTVSVTIPVELLAVWLPNSFTPGGNSNNRFFFKSVNKLTDVKFEVYSRWGERLFLFEKAILDCSKYTDLEKEFGWDGYFKGSLVPVGTYKWRLSYKRYGNNKPFDKSGTINVIR
ncbi:MAG: gliding motility-associated C-terminal domain-containing protein [Bacteroidales bacterium]|jgi:hypothetical protein|nr:gliding motility-associated C-terminal domain-containing protein [Bacteroidales bacterium]